MKSFKTLIFSLIIGVSIFLFPNFLEKTKALEGNIKIKYGLEAYNDYTDNEINQINELFDTLEKNYPGVYYIAVENVRYIEVFYSTNSNFANNQGITLYAYERSNTGDTGTVSIGFRFNNSFNRYAAQVYVKNKMSDDFKNIEYITEYLKNKGSLSKVFKSDVSSSVYIRQVGICFNNTCTKEEEYSPSKRIVRTNIPNADVFLGVNESSINSYLKSGDIYDSINITLYDDNAIIPIGGTIPILLKKEVKPTIDFSKIDIGKTTFISTEFSIFDTEKYIYEYSLYDTKNWIEISKNPFLIQANKNGTIFARILDRTTEEYVTSSSFTFLNTFPSSEEIDISNGIYQKNGKTYSNYIRIPISEIYDQESKIWKKYQKIFVADSKTSTTPKIDFYIYLKDKEGTLNSVPVPLQVYLNDSIIDLNEYLNKVINSPTTDADGYGGGFSLEGGSFGGGGGGGRFDDDTSINSCTKFPLTYEINMKSFLHYLSLTLNFSICQDLTNKTPSDFTTEYIYIFYNGKIYTDEFDAMEDLFKPNESNNIFDFLGSNQMMNFRISEMLENVWNYFKQSKISSYIFLLISGTLAIVLINSFNR